MNLRVLITAALALALAACATATPTAPPAATPDPGNPSGYPAFVTPTVPPVGDIPPAAADSAVIHGILMVNRANPQAIQAAILYLAELVPEAQGTPYLAAFDRTLSPNALTDSEGRFLFANVTPGTYALVLDRISDSYMLGDPEMTQEDFLFEARAGQVLDLGELVYTELPGYGPAP